VRDKNIHWKLQKIIIIDFNRKRLLLQNKIVFEQLSLLQRKHNLISYYDYNFKIEKSIAYE